MAIKRVKAVRSKRPTEKRLVCRRRLPTQPAFRVTAAVAGAIAINNQQRRETLFVLRLLLPISFYSVFFFFRFPLHSTGGDEALQQ